MLWRCACTPDGAGAAGVTAQRSTGNCRHAAPSWCRDGQLGATSARWATTPAASLRQDGGKWQLQALLQLLPPSLCAALAWRAWLPPLFMSADRLHAVQRAKQEGATLLTGGKRPSHLKKGYFGEGAALQLQAAMQAPAAERCQDGACTRGLSIWYLLNAATPSCSGANSVHQP